MTYAIFLAERNLRDEDSNFLISLKYFYNEILFLHRAANRGFAQEPPLLRIQE